MIFVAKLKNIKLRRLDVWEWSLLSVLCRNAEKNTAIKHFYSRIHGQYVEFIPKEK